MKNPLFVTISGQRRKYFMLSYDNESLVMSPLRRHIFVCFYGKMGAFRP